MRDKHGATGTENVSRAAPPNSLGRRNRVELVREERKLERVVLRIVQRHKTVFRGDNALQGFVDAAEQLIEVGRLVEGVNHVGNHLALGLHALECGNVLRVEQDSFDPRILQAIMADQFKPAPGRILSAQAATLTHAGTRQGGNFLEALADVLDVSRVNDRMDTAAC